MIFIGVDVTDTSILTVRRFIFALLAHKNIEGSIRIPTNLCKFESRCGVIVALMNKTGMLKKYSSLIGTGVLLTKVLPRWHRRLKNLWRKSPNSGQKEDPNTTY